jgi:hypothetical protein
MTLSRVIPICAFFALLGFFAGPLKAAEKNHGIEQETFDGIMKILDDAAKSKSYRNDPKHGDGTTPYEDTPSKPGLMIGIDIWPGTRDKTVQYVRGARPIFLNNKGEILEGKIHGWVGTGSQRLEAKPGYALGGLKIHTDAGEIAGMSAVFYKVTATGLDKSDSHESKYFGHHDPNTAKLIGGTGDPIVGIHGLVAKDAKSHNFGIGLIMIGEKKKKK